MKQCVVIGGSGFLGKAIVEELVKRGDYVIAVDRRPENHNALEGNGVTHVQADIVEYEAVQRVVDGADEVYHVAGMLGTSELNHLIRKAVEVNVLGTLNVIEACIQAEVPRLFYPVKPNCWLNTYSITKKASEDFAALFDSEYATNIVRLRWFNAYGPQQHTHPVRKIIPTFCLLARFQLPLAIFGTGQNIVDMVYSTDIAHWTIEAMRKDLHTSVYDLGRGVPLSVLHVAQDVNKIACNTKITHSQMRKGETESTVLVADITPLQAAFSACRISMTFSPWIDTLEKTYRYYYDLPDEQALEALTYHGFNLTMLN